MRCASVLCMCSEHGVKAEEQHTSLSTWQVEAKESPGSRAFLSGLSLHTSSAVGARCQQAGQAAAGRALVSQGWEL